MHSAQAVASSHTIDVYSPTPLLESATRVHTSIAAPHSQHWAARSRQSLFVLQAVSGLSVRSTTVQSAFRQLANRSGLAIAAQAGHATGPVPQTLVRYDEAASTLNATTSLGVGAPQVPQQVAETNVQSECEVQSRRMPVPDPPEGLTEPPTAEVLPPSAFARPPEPFDVLPPVPPPSAPPLPWSSVAPLHPIATRIIAMRPRGRTC